MLSLPFFAASSARERFQKLKVWGKSHALALNAISVAKKIRGSESSALRMQMIRAAMSIPT
ncbi:MAG: four helix bundle protein, partial [Gemmatimonadaceae bacterium]